MNSVEGFGAVSAVACAGGADIARLYDSAGNDTFDGRADRPQRFAARGFTNEARGFEQVIACATAGGNDRATLRDSRGAGPARRRSHVCLAPRQRLQHPRRGLRQLDGPARRAGSGDVARLTGSRAATRWSSSAAQRAAHRPAASQIRTDDFQRRRASTAAAAATALEFYTASENSYAPRQR